MRLWEAMILQSIRTKISLITMAAIVVSVLLIGGVGVLFIRNEGETGSDREMALLCDNNRKKLNQYMMGIGQSVDMLTLYAVNELNSEALAESGVVGTQGYGEAMAGRNRQSEQQAALDAYMEQYAEKVEQVFRSAANYTKGVCAYYYCLNPEITSAYPGFLYTKIDTPDFVPHDAVSVFDDSMDGSSWLAPYFNTNLNLKMISYVAPIYKADTFVGVIGMDIGYETLVDQINSIQIYETGYACLIDAEGNVVYHPHLEAGTRVDSFAHAMAEAKGSGENDVQSFRCTYEGIEKKAVYTALENGLRLMIIVPASETSAAWFEMVKGFLLIGGAILLVFGIVITLTMQRIIEPLQTLTAASQRIAEGDYDVKLEYDKNDEVGILTRSFQRLVEHLKAYINDLNSKAYKDALTHVKNKGAFEIQLRKLEDLLHKGETGSPLEFAIVMFDCDFLKSINDQYGHANGDIYLQTGCKFICKLFAHSPVFRIGGDEFAAILQGQDFENRESLLQRFDEQVRQANAEAENPWEKVHISKGMAVYDPTVDLDVESVFNRADKDMYEEKARMKTHRTI